MSCNEIVSISAIILGPILAVQIEKYLERRRENKNRRLSIFKTLMATRGTVLSWTHVEALNRIDLEFSNNKKFEKVITTWQEYFDNLSQKACPHCRRPHRKIHGSFRYQVFPDAP